MNKTFAVFANGGTMTTAQTALWQYDYGQILVVQGIELPTAYEVQFCNAGDSTTITSVGDSTGVVIPDQFLQNGETIYAYIYLHTGDADGETEYKITIPVMDRAQPTDIEPTPAQESTIGQLIDALNSGVQAAEEAAEKGPKIVGEYWYTWDADAGEYVSTEIQATGIDGNSIWTTNQQPFIISTNVGYYYKEQLTGRAGSDPIIGDIVVQSADKVWAVFDFTSAGRPKVQLIGSIKGAPGAPGEDGADGSGVWYTTERISGGENPFVRRRDLIGREGAAVQVHDLLFAPDVGYEGEPTTLYEITSVGTACALKRLCKMQGEDGTSPGVTITEIEGGHRVTITDEAHPDGQSFDVMDGTGGSGSSDYNDLSNKPQIAGVTLSGNKSLADLGIAAASDIPTVPVQSVNGKTGAVVLNASDVGAGTYTKPSGGIPKSDLASAVQSSLSKADTALQSAPVTSVNGQTGAVTVPEPFVVTYSTSDMTTWTCDKTYSQIVTAAMSGLPVVCAVVVAGNPALQISSVEVGSSMELIFRQDVGRGNLFRIEHYSTDVIISDAVSIDPSDIGAVASSQGVANANKVLKVNSSGVVVPEDDRFMVTCTPTAQDLSGVMDKTVAEIDAAYKAGKKIVFVVPMSASEYATSDCTSVYNNSAYTYSNMLYAYVFDLGNDVIVVLRTPLSDNPDTNNYSTRIYPLATSQWTGGSY